MEKRNLQQSDILMIQKAVKVMCRRSREEADFYEDYVQESALQLLQTRYMEGYWSDIERGRFVGLTVLNVIRNSRRKNKPTEALQDAQLSEWVSAPVQGTALHFEELASQMAERWPRDRNMGKHSKAFALRTWGFRYKEIGEELGCGAARAKQLCKEAEDFVKEKSCI